MISRTLLVIARDFSLRLDAERVAGDVAEGLRTDGWDVDLLPIGADLTDAAAIALVRSGDFEARMRAARAVVIVEAQLDERTLAGSVAFEVATRARQGGVPAYAVTGKDDVDSFDARILDLQTIIEARTHRSLVDAGSRLAGVV